MTDNQRLPPQAWMDDQHCTDLSTGISRHSPGLLCAAKCESSLCRHEVRDRYAVQIFHAPSSFSCVQSLQMYDAPLLPKHSARPRDSNLTPKHKLRTGSIVFLKSCYKTHVNAVYMITIQRLAFVARFEKHNTACSKLVLP